MSRKEVLNDPRFVKLSLKEANDLFISISSLALHFEADKSDTRFLRDLSNYITYKKEIENTNSVS